MLNKCDDFLNMCLYIFETLCNHNVHISRFCCLQIVVCFWYFQGHCFIVFDPKAFTDDFEDRMSELMDYCRHLEPVSLTIE